MFSYKLNYQSVSDVYKKFSEGQLIVDDTYQRRSIWDSKDKVRLVETILLDLVIPELFFWKASTDPNTGDSITHIVDGQQRVKAIVEYIENKYKLNPKFMLDQSMITKFGNKTFSQLQDSEKTALWQYSLTIVEIDAKATRDDIIVMFRRLNLTDYSLNDQERRNSIIGEFSSVCRELSADAFWDAHGLFKTSDIRRMKDVEFCGSILLLWRNGVIDQTDQRALNQAYDDLRVGYENAVEDKTAVRNAMALLEKFINENNIRFIQRKAQLYTMFCVAFYMIREKIDYNDEHRVRLNRFIMLYDLFGNDIDLTGKLSAEQASLFDMLKKYKLASSEGLNKHANRMIRFTVLKDFVFSLADSQLEAIDPLHDLLLEYKQQHADEVDIEPDEE